MAQLSPFAEAYKNVPEDLQDAMGSVDATEAIESIAKKYGLMLDQAGELTSIVGNVMVGILSINDFVATIASKLRLTNPVAEQVAHDVSASIFAKVRESMRKVHETHKEHDLFSLKEEKLSQRGSTDDVRAHLNEDDALESELRSVKSSEPAPKIRVSDLIKAAIPPTTKVSDLIKATIPPDNLPVEKVVIQQVVAKKDDEDPVVFSSPIPKPSKSGDGEITRMPKVKQTVDPYRESI